MRSDAGHGGEETSTWVLAGPQCRACQSVSGSGAHGNATRPFVPVRQLSSSSSERYTAICGVGSADVKEFTAAPHGAAWVCLRDEGVGGVGGNGSHTALSFSVSGLQLAGCSK